MSKLIAICGLDCEKCEARIATINNDNELRNKIAKQWSALNGVDIAPEMINCVGCKVEGVKTIYCDKMCPIKKCATKMNHNSCGECNNMETCEHLHMVLSHNKEALENLKKNK